MSELHIKEVWKVIDGFPEYEVSDLGRIRSHRRAKPRIMQPVLTSSGTTQISMRKGDKQYTRQIPKLVLEAFVGGRESEKYVVNHKDGDCSNNALSNLEWAPRYGLDTLEKLECPVKCVETGVVYKSITRAARDTGINLATLRRAVGRAKQTAGGFTWVRA